MFPRQSGARRRLWAEVCEYTVPRMLGGQEVFRGFQVVCDVVSAAKKRAQSGVRGIRTLTANNDLPGGDRGQGQNRSAHIIVCTTGVICFMELLGGLSKLT